MVIVGLLLILVGALLIVLAVFTADVDLGGLEFMGIDVSPAVLFLLGVAAGAAVLWGFGILKYGTKRSLRQRREHKRLEELHGKLERVERVRAEDRDVDGR